MNRPIETIYTDKQIQKRLKYWQKKLRLQDWIIDIEIKRLRHLEVSEEAEINYIPENKQARISIVDHADYPESSWFPHDMDWNIVHELLHLHFYKFKTEQNTADIEQSIESLVHGYMALERK